MKSLSLSIYIYIYIERERERASERERERDGENLSNCHLKENCDTFMQCMSFKLVIYIYIYIYTLMCMCAYTDISKDKCEHVRIRFNMNELRYAVRNRSG